ncbi:unnamed protein product [Caenorhabditis angaria]|uniref:CRAL-TRIO domain-containing protein n=1 Tax=Caenorhabditis angaria TaxID=860376 RepID=A0A9P1J3W9_9PELO|nr:unnamed protein product [Caenorhabditis angaria]
MTKTTYTPFGLPLTDEALKIVNEVRLKLTQPIHPNFDTDFNIYRFVMSAERTHKKEKEVISSAAKALNNHLRYRKAMDLDSDNIPNFDKNPIFQKRLMPRGEILDKCDDHNRLLWYIEYATITVESIAHSIQSSEACKYQFLQFEYMLRQVMKQEAKTGKLSSLRHIVDMNGYEINPFTMVFVTSGTLAYYSQLFHFENYPELVVPVDMVNIARWIHVPYKLAKSMMPAGFSDKFRLHDSHFMKTLNEDIHVDDIPTSLGGNDKEIQFTGAQKVDPTDYWKPTNEKILETLESFHIPGRKTRHITLNVTAPKTLSWYYSTDGDVYFGVFFEGEATNNNEENDPNLDNMEMVYPWLKITAKLVHERDQVTLTRTGKYHIVFCNKHSWLSRRSVEFYGQISDAEGIVKRVYSDGTTSSTEIRI